VGAFLAFMGNKYLWPTWEYLSIQNYIRKSTEANLAFLQEIHTSYESKYTSPASYRLARKQAFLAIGDLNAAFQRMAQEPKKGEDISHSSKILSLNQEFLNSAVSLGTFIRTQATTKMSSFFSNYINAISSNLTPFEVKPPGREAEIEAADAFFREQYISLAARRKQEKKTGQEEISEELRSAFQEVQLVHEQLKWLYELSLSISKLQQDLKT
jgi:uncharacterized membrane protein YccC